MQGIWCSFLFGQPSTVVLLVPLLYLDRMWYHHPIWHHTLCINEKRKQMDKRMSITSHRLKRCVFYGYTHCGRTALHHACNFLPTTLSSI